MSAELFQKIEAPFAAHVTKYVTFEALTDRNPETVKLAVRSLYWSALLKRDLVSTDAVPQDMLPLTVSSSDDSQALSAALFAYGTSLGCDRYDELGDVLGDTLGDGVDRWVRDIVLQDPEGVLAHEDCWDWWACTITDAEWKEGDRRLEAA